MAEPLWEREPGGVPLSSGNDGHYIAGNCGTSALRSILEAALFQGEHAVDRRDVLKSALTLVAGTGRRGSMPSAVSQAPGRSSLARDSRGPFIETKDGQQLFVKEWGTGTPVVFSRSVGPAFGHVGLSDGSALGTGNALRCIRSAWSRAIEHPGTGDDYDTLADDLAAVLDTKRRRRQGLTQVDRSVTSCVSGEAHEA
jgi:hypothetical protein